jgi:DNA polymerase-3 subunit delta'
MSTADVLGADGAGADPFAAVVGQPDAVAVLRTSAVHPVHAYLLVGSIGWGTRAGARAFAGELLASGESPGEAARTRSLAATERHPSMFVVERVGASISVEQAREIVRRASLSPPEGERQVIVLVDFHLVGPRAPMLLKTIEEPPPSTFFVVLAEEVTPELETIASRCVRVDFGPIPTAIVASTLRAEGFDGAVAETAAVSGGGDLDRARLLAADPKLAERRAFWLSVPDRLDGRGATVAAIVSEIAGRLDEVLAPLSERQAAEMARALEDAEHFGGTKGSLADLEARHKREARRVRADELQAGLSAIAAGYRAHVDTSEGRAAYSTAGAAIAQISERLVFNPNERLALEALLLSLPKR